MGVPGHHGAIPLCDQQPSGEKRPRAGDRTAAVEVLLEQDSSGQALFQTAAGILHDDVRREGMASAMAELGIRD